MYKINILLKQNQKIFHTNDLAILWGITNKNTLYTTIKRYVDKKILIPIQKGLYSVIPVAQTDPVRLGVAILHRFAYVSCETILSRHDIIFQKSDAITIVSDISKKFRADETAFVVRRLKDRYLFNDTGIESIDGLYFASLERAVADMLYFNPLFYFDNKKAIDGKRVKTIQMEVGYQ